MHEDPAGQPEKALFAGAGIIDFAPPSAFFGESRNVFGLG